MLGRLGLGDNFQNLASYRNNFGSHRHFAAPFVRRILKYQKTARYRPVALQANLYTQGPRWGGLTRSPQAIALVSARRPRRTASEPVGNAIGPKFKSNLSAQKASLQKPLMDSDYLTLLAGRRGGPAPTVKNQNVIAHVG